MGSGDMFREALYGEGLSAHMDDLCKSGVLTGLPPEGSIRCLGVIQRHLEPNLVNNENERSEERNGMSISCQRCRLFPYTFLALSPLLTFMWHTCSVTGCPKPFAAVTGLLIVKSMGTWKGPWHLPVWALSGPPLPSPGVAPGHRCRGWGCRSVALSSGACS